MRINRSMGGHGPPFHVVFQEDDWAIVEDGLTQVGNYDGEPWIVHCCSRADEVVDSVSWNYVRSTEYALRINRPARRYACIQCEAKAPDLLITIHTLYKD